MTAHNKIWGLSGQFLVGATTTSCDPNCRITVDRLISLVIVWGNIGLPGPVMWMCTPRLWDVTAGCSQRWKGRLSSLINRLLFMVTYSLLLQFNCAWNATQTCNSVDFTADETSIMRTKSDFDLNVCYFLQRNNLNSYYCYSCLIASFEHTEGSALSCQIHFTSRCVHLCMKTKKNECLKQELVEVWWTLILCCSLGKFGAFRIT